MWPGKCRGTHGGNRLNATPPGSQVFGHRAGLAATRKRRVPAYPHPNMKVRQRLQAINRLATRRLNSARCMRS
jgi:succinate dehydrogenase/fumarate reductase flavoprotein subunit